MVKLNRKPLALSLVIASRLSMRDIIMRTQDPLLPSNIFLNLDNPIDEEPTRTLLCAEPSP
jgi:hypothetical protein